jgi:hypothetical protein
VRLWVTVEVAMPDGDAGEFEGMDVLAAAKDALSERGEDAIVGWEDKDWQPTESKGEA